MFGQNKVRSPSSFSFLKEDELQVTSIFYTLQGEGPLAGRPAVFVRLTGCPLTCKFCDTDFSNGDVMTFEQIWTQITAVVQAHRVLTVKGPKLLVVITGGEPLAQPSITQFLIYLRERKVQTQIESAGIIERSLPFSTTLVISPKMNERTEQPLRITPAMLESADALKFVVSKTRKPYTVVPALVHEWARNFGYEEVFLSPMNEYTKPPSPIDSSVPMSERVKRERVSFWEPGLLDLRKCQENHEYAAMLAMRYGFRLSMQMHLFANIP